MGVDRTGDSVSLSPSSTEKNVSTIFFLCVQHLLCEIVLYSRFIILASFFFNVDSARVSFLVNKKNCGVVGRMIWQCWVYLHDFLF